MADRRMTFFQHIGELRNRLIRSVIYFALAVAVSFAFRDWLFNVLRYPLPDDVKLYYFGVTEAFFFYMKLALITGLILAFPLILVEVYLFFSPALTKSEKKLVITAIPVVILLFAAGAVFTFLVLIPLSVRFLLGFTGEGLESILQVEKYYGFVTGFSVAGGLAFEMPVILWIFAKLGWVTARGLWRNFRYAFLVILILTAILTPTPDAFTMLVLSIPLILLYIISILAVARVKVLTS